jgi:bifunctional ADP-heptose synthase (sugar kinase/adenylyltransferase)
LSPEAPVPVFLPERVETNPGMAGNVVQNLKSISDCVVKLYSQKTEITKTRFVDDKSNHMFLRVDEGESNIDQFKLTDEIIKEVSEYDIVVVSDYDKGFLSLEDLKLISDSHPLTFIDTKKPLSAEMRNYTFIKINEVEWENCKGQEYETWRDRLIITMSERGAMYDGITYPVNNDIEVRDLSGAGDTFMASLVISYLKTKNIEVSIEYANDCATKVVQKRGVVTL